MKSLLRTSLWKLPHVCWWTSITLGVWFHSRLIVLTCLHDTLVAYRLMRTAAVALLHSHQAVLH